MDNYFSKSQQAGNQHSEEYQQPPSGPESVCATPQALKGKRLAHNSWGLILASLQSAISESQAPAWSCLAAPSLWPDTKPGRVSFCCRVLPCDGVSVLLGQRPLSKTLHTHREWTVSFQSGHA